jgi:hypothetical protein
MDHAMPELRHHRMAPVAPTPPSEPLVSDPNSAIAAPPQDIAAALQATAARPPAFQLPERATEETERPLSPQTGHAPSILPSTPNVLGPALGIAVPPPDIVVVAQRGATPRLACQRLVLVTIPLRLSPLMGLAERIRALEPLALDRDLELVVRSMGIVVRPLLTVEPAARRRLALVPDLKRL